MRLSNCLEIGAVGRLGSRSMATLKRSAKSPLKLAKSRAIVLKSFWGPFLPSVSRSKKKLDPKISASRHNCEKV